MNYHELVRAIALEAVSVNWVNICHDDVEEISECEGQLD